MIYTFNPSPPPPPKHNLTVLFFCCHKKEFLHLFLGLMDRFFVYKKILEGAPKLNIFK